MVYATGLGFCIIRRNKPISIKISRQLVEAFNINGKLFGRSPQKFVVVVCDSEKEFKKESKYYYFSGAKGTVLRDCSLVTKSQDFLKMPDGEYRTIVDHEMTHVFWQSFYRMTKPVWIDEGIASIVGLRFRTAKERLLKQMRSKRISYEILRYRYLYRDFVDGKMVNLMYQVWKHFILYITGNKPHKIIDFMDRYSKNPSKQNYHRLFKSFFGKSEKEKFGEFVDYLKKG